MNEAKMSKNHSPSAASSTALLMAEARPDPSIAQVGRQTTHRLRHDPGQVGRVRRGSGVCGCDLSDVAQRGQR